MVGFNALGPSLGSVVSSLLPWLSKENRRSNPLFLITPASFNSDQPPTVSYSTKPTVRREADGSFTPVSATTAHLVSVLYNLPENVLPEMVPSDLPEVVSERIITQHSTLEVVPDLDADDDDSSYCSKEVDVSDLNTHYLRTHKAVDLEFDNLELEEGLTIRNHICTVREPVYLLIDQLNLRDIHVYVRPNTKLAVISTLHRFRFPPGCVVRRSANHIWIMASTFQFLPDEQYSITVPAGSYLS